MLYKQLLAFDSVCWRLILSKEKQKSYTMIVITVHLLTPLITKHEKKILVYHAICRIFNLGKI